MAEQKFFNFYTVPEKIWVKAPYWSDRAFPLVLAESGLHLIIREEFDNRGTKLGEEINGPATTQTFAEAGARSLNDVSYELHEHVIFVAPPYQWEQITARKEISGATPERRVA